MLVLHNVIMRSTFRLSQFMHVGIKCKNTEYLNYDDRQKLFVL